MARGSGKVRDVFAWCLPTYAAMAMVLLMAFAADRLPFRTQIGLSDVWMVIALILPVPTLIAAVKAAAVPLHAEDGLLHFWRPLLGWCMVAAALSVNVFCFIVIGRALR